MNVEETSLTLTVGLGNWCFDRPDALAKFDQLKRNKRFDNFIMLVWVQGSLFHIAAGSHHVQETWGGHKIVCTGVKFKSCFSVVENHTNRFLLLAIQKKYTIYDAPFRS